MTSPIPTVGGKHTPGPWEIGDDGQIHYEGMLRPVWNIYGGQGLRDGRLVASVEHFKEDHYPNANARLIAAAPALLEALKAQMAVSIRSMRRLGFLSEHDVLDCTAQARAALELATGSDAAWTEVLAQATGGEDVR